MLFLLFLHPFVPPRHPILALSSCHCHLVPVSALSAVKNLLLLAAWLSCRAALRPRQALLQPWPSSSPLSVGVALGGGSCRGSGAVESEAASALTVICSASGGVLAASSASSCAGALSSPLVAKGAWTRAFSHSEPLCLASSYASASASRKRRRGRSAGGCLCSTPGGMLYWHCCRVHARQRPP